MLFTGKETNKNPEGYRPQVNNDLPIVKASAGGKFGFWFLVIITLGIFYIVKRVTTMNWLNTVQNKINKAASDVDIQLEKRYDTLTKLVDSVKGHTQFNKEVYENIAAFRNGVDPYAAKSGVQVSNDLNKKQELINQISSGIAMQFEQYPTLGADASISRLMTESIMLEKEVAASRRNYNALVDMFNSRIYTWPTCVVIDNKNYQGIPLFIASETKRSDVKISFN